jgi:general secretion pathway protein G
LNRQLRRHDGRRPASGLPLQHRQWHSGCRSRRAADAARHPGGRGWQGRQFQRHPRHTAALPDDGTPRLHRLQHQVPIDHGAPTRKARADLPSTAIKATPCDVGARRAATTPSSWKRLASGGGGGGASATGASGTGPAEQARQVTDRGRARRRDHRMRRRGFTLIELMVVLVIIGVLAALIVPNVLDRADDARATAARTDVNNLVQALKLYKLDNQRYPSAEQGLQALVRQAHGRRRAAELEALPRQAAQRPLGPPLPVPQPGA